MNSTKVIIILALLLTMKTTIGQPVNCNCRIAFISNGTAHYSNCKTRGCSVGTNPLCDSYYFIDLNCCDGGLYGIYHGCNCPNSAYNANHNGAYGRPFGHTNYNYNYTTCTDYGLNARDDSGSVPYGSNVAIDCCNFCCGRNDSYPTTTTTSTSTSTTTTKITTSSTTTAIIPTTLKTTLSTTTMHIYTTTSASTSGGRTIILDKSFYLSGLTMLVLTTLKIN